MKSFVAALVVLTSASFGAGEANRLTYLDDTSPFWPNPHTAKFITPQWIGEPGVDAVVILAIDDMREAAKYEAFLRPILDRLKLIDGRAPVSVMTNTVATDDPQFPAWLKEGVTIESHTLTHPCPCLGKATFDEASRVYHESVDLLTRIPGNKPVAFRMPCCDSMNSASPRFFAEIFNRTSPEGHWLSADSSVFTLPPGERFTKYFPAELRPPMTRAFGDYAGFIEDYPYPYVIGKLCWEFPCMVPSDWEAFNIMGPKSPTMLEDWKAALDYTVKAQGVFTAVFHPHGWSDPAQWVELIDYAQKTHGSRVMFLNFREALERIEKHALGGYTLRAANGDDHGVRLLDLNEDGFMDVVIGSKDRNTTRIWQPQEKRWTETSTPCEVGKARFGIVRDRAVSIVAPSGEWTWKENAWAKDKELSNGLPKPLPNGTLFRDFDHDGACELLSNNEIFAWNDESSRWTKADYSLPPDCAVLDAKGGDNGLRFTDLNGDGFDDVLQSNETGYAIYLWARTVRADLGWKRGWPHLVAKGGASPDSRDAKVLPFVKDGHDYGAWFHRNRIVWQNEALYLPDSEAFLRSYKDIIAFEVPPMKSQKDSLEAMRPRPGFTVELVAAEPLIESPVAFDWDAQGRLWVVEMRDYPSGMDGKGKPGGIVKVLTDRDGDGRYDDAQTFIEDLPFPTGIFPWRHGVLLGASKDILFAADTNGDGKADERRVLFTGFKEGNQQHRQNGYEWGLDGWIYGANGDSGGEIKSPGRNPLGADKPVSISGRDFRFRPDSGEFAPESGQAQYGRHRDDWGNWFGNNNSTWLWHYTIEDRYLRRNTQVAVKTTKQMLADYAESSRVFAANVPAIRFNQPQSVGHLTSGCSPAPYRDELFGPGFSTSVFICEPVHNAVHREVLESNGATFTSRRATDEQDREFLASADPWFRPVMAKTGPDGALYIADFHRFVLEHPEWIAPETQSRLDLRGGSETGRIYRVLPTGAKLRPIPNLSRLENTALAAALDSPNGWQRDTVHRLLFERNAKDTASDLAQLAEGAKNPKVRLQALAALESLQVLDANTVRNGLSDPHAAVRVQALRSSESLNASPAELLGDLVRLIEDPNFAVRRQLALTLGAFDNEQSRNALQQLAKRGGDQPQMKLAVQLAERSRGSTPAAFTEKPAATSQTSISLPKPDPGSRTKVIAKYGAVDSLKARPERGPELFRQSCIACHRYKGEGNEVGPDLAMVADKPTDWLLTAIFDPNAAIEDRYRAHIVKLTSGTELSGLIVTETSNNLVLRMIGGVDVPILRSNIASQQRAERSLMPDGFESVLNPQDIADLLAWLRKR
jgi:putative membrane-bound dehydrogenase-like protein